MESYGKSSFKAKKWKITGDDQIEITYLENYDDYYDEENDETKTMKTIFKLSEDGKKLHS